MALLLLVAMLAAVSMLIGASQVSLSGLWSREGSLAADVMLISRLPRTLALILAGMSMAVAGTLMQMLAQNRFVEPSTAGTVESASLGLLTISLLAPDVTPTGKMIAAALFALAGTMLFLAILRRISQRSVLIVPLVGLVLGGIINAIATFHAYQFDMLQSLHAWSVGDFSAVLRGRYELLWISLVLTLLAWYTADRFTAAGLGAAFSTSIGVDHRRMVILGLIIVSMVTAAAMVTAGIVPFLGLIVPNLVSLVLGDQLRRTLPCVMLTGAAFVLLCDIAGRLILFPHEVPIGTVVGVTGSVLFLIVLLRRGARLG